MPDFDVAAVALVTPPASAVKTTYRPAFTVRNNGIHDALATGYVRIYKAGQLVFESNVYTETIAPGATGLAQADQYWTAEVEGSYFAQGYITTPKDSVEWNNQLAPTPFTVTGGTPPPPPVVTPHASQHEEGGDDQLTIDGLTGRAAEPQEPLDHNNDSHTVPYQTTEDTSNAINGHNVDPTAHPGLVGGPHAPTHQDGGDDQLNVAGLSGTLADPQTPTTHENEAHGRDFIDATDAAAMISNHNTDTSAHTSDNHLEKTMNKGTANGYAGLDGTVLVPRDNLGSGYSQSVPYAFLRVDRTWSVPPAAIPLAHGSSHEAGAADEISAAGLHGTLADPQTPTSHAASHQWGGSDELFVTGLHGVLEDPQKIQNHKSTHETGGADELSVAGLRGVLHDQQNPQPHYGTHQNGGGDEISVAGLSGLLADRQTPLIHGNTDHVMTTDLPLRTSPITPGSTGVTDYVARADHRHPGAGFIAAERGTAINIAPTRILAFTLPAGGYLNALMTRRMLHFVTHLRGEANNPGYNVILEQRIGFNGGPAIVLYTWTLTAPNGQLTRWRVNHELLCERITAGTSVCLLSMIQHDYPPANPAAPAALDSQTLATTIDYDLVTTVELWAFKTIPNPAVELRLTEVFTD